MSVKAFIDDIDRRSNLDHSCAEIQDIQSAVKEILRRHVDKIEENRQRNLEKGENDVFPFRIHHTQLVGSMYETTGVWKYLSGSPQSVYFCIEFDFLAVLEKVCEPMFKPTFCSGHLEMLPTVSATDSNLNGYRSSWRVTQHFNRSICRAIVSTCSCYNTESSFTSSSRLPVLPWARKGCSKCTVNRQTGYLTMLVPDGALVRPVSCSFTLLWTSTAKALRNPKGSLCQNVVILIDFLPAFELSTRELRSEDPRFSNYAVAKKCSVCVDARRPDTWRFSCNLRESDFILTQVSQGHKRCYQTLKYFSEKFIKMSSYHYKTALLHHCVTCKKDDKNYSECIFEILQFLELAYSTRCLKAWINQMNLLKGDNCTFKLKAIKALIESFDEIGKQLKVDESGSRYTLAKAHQVIDGVMSKHFKKK